ncbi:MAG: polymer-forming cytoskeletal protein [Xanthomonadales bacterium]|nr:polymer-forming cytoskeletal protein [Xanthomonadales bacterium]
MFDKRNEKQDSADQVQQDRSASRPATAIARSALIGPGITVNGDISGSENLVIEGKVEGKVQLPGHQVEVGSSGKVHADVTAKFVKVEGELRGDIDGKEKVVITKAGKVQGNITAPRVQLEDGAIFKGSIDINPNESAPVELPLSGQNKADNVKTLSSDSSVKESGLTVKGG